MPWTGEVLSGYRAPEPMSPSDDASRAEEAARFLARFPPFQDQDPLELEDLAANASERAFPSGTEILHKAGDPASHLFVIRRGVIELLDGDHVIDRLGEGEMFGMSVLSGLGPALSARARGDTDCYLIDADHARSLIGTPAGLAALAATLTRWRERDAVEQHVRHAGVDDDLVTAIGSAGDLPALVATSRQLPAMVRTLLGNGVDPVEIGHVVGTTIDHLTIRLIELFIDEQGEPPAAFAWVALGSAARHEQALTTDQDHAIAYGDGSDLETIESFFAALATSVTDGLEACGIDRCRGNVMAVNPAWRRTREGWRHRFADYVADLNPMGARIAGIAFDYRRVTGAVDIESVLDDVIRAARDDAGFLRRLGATVLESVPPTGRSRDIVVKRRGEHPGRVDIKHDGITIVTNLARISAILAGVTENSTAERLRTSASAGVLPVATRDDLLEAFGLLWGIRLEHHATRIERKEAPDDFVDPATLPPITSAALGGSFRAIAAAQEWLARELGLPHHQN